MFLHVHERLFLQKRIHIADSLLPFTPLLLISTCCSIPSPSYFASQDEHAANLKLEQEREAEAEAQRQKQVHLETNIPLVLLYVFNSIKFVYKLMFSRSERTTL